MVGMMYQSKTKSPAGAGLLNFDGQCATIIVPWEAFYGSITLLKSTAFSTSAAYNTGGKTSLPDPPPATTV